MLKAPVEVVDDPLEVSPTPSEDDISYRLPKTLFSYAPLYQEMFRSDQDPLCNPILTCNETSSFGVLFYVLLLLTSGWSILFLCEMIQIGFIIFIASLVKNNIPLVEGCPTPDLLRLLSIFVFSSYIFTDIMETIEIALYFKNIPTREADDEIYKYLVRFRSDIKKGNIMGPAEKFTDDYGISRLLKLAILFFSIIPKFGIATGLWYFGCGYLQYSSDNSELILNTVSLLFILDIDDILFISLIPELVRKMMDALPVVTVPLNSYFAVLSQQLRIGFVIGSTIIGWRYIFLPC